MDVYTLAFIAFALSMDAFAVSVGNGISMLKVTPWAALKTGLFFGIFQGVMPVIGFIGGISFREYIVKFDHWIAFALLVFLGVKMILESGKKDDGKPSNPTGTAALLTMAVATSIDALAAGVTFSMFDIDIIKAAVFICIVTLTVCFIGVYLGKYVGRLFKKRAAVAGGVVLCIIGTKILFEGIMGNM